MGSITDLSNQGGQPPHVLVHEDDLSEERRTRLLKGMRSRVNIHPSLAKTLVFSPSIADYVEADESDVLLEGEVHEESRVFYEDVFE